MTNPKVGISINEIEKLLAEREEARDLARKMFHVLQQFPTSIDELIEDWPDDPPRWLYDR